MKSRNGILSAGNWIIDHVKLVDRFPEQDALATILGETVGTGGMKPLEECLRLGETFGFRTIPLMKPLNGNSGPCGGTYAGDAPR